MSVKKSARSRNGSDAHTDTSGAAGMAKTLSERTNPMHRSPRDHGGRTAAIGLLLAGALVVSSAAVAQAAVTDPNPNALETANAQLSKTAATEGMVLLENNGALPLSKSTNLALFGVGAYATVKGGTGSGDVNQRYKVTVRQGLESAGYKITTSPDYWNAMSSAYDTKYGATSTGSPFGVTIDYSSVEQALTPTSVQPTAATDTALFVVARNSGEGADRNSGKGDYLLSDTEYNDIQLIGQSYKRVIVVLNTGGIVDTSFFKQINASTTDSQGKSALDGLLLMSQAGQEGGNALAEVLDGDVSPSGKLTDTWASQYSYYPASATFGANDGNTTTEQYSEGVYVGYRYFDSFYKTINPASPASVVAYPFGYGLSYTKFDIDVQGVNADLNTVSIKARVTNTGKYSGKSVVETYFSAPAGGEDKPYQELAGYGKTDLLQPGASQTVTISFPTTEMASYYDSKSAYILSAGNYLIRVGDSSRSTHVAAKLRLGKDTVTQQASPELTDQKLTTAVLTGSSANFYSYPQEARELAFARTIDLHGNLKTQNVASPYKQNVTVDSTSPYYAIDGSQISSTTAYLDKKQTNWEGTGTPYAPKTGESVKYVSTSPSSTLFDVAKGKTSMQQFVAGLTVTQLANIVEGSSATGSTASAAGAAGYTTSAYENLGIPGMTLSDGPAGLRLTQVVNTTTPTTYQYATAWPIGTMLAQTWNRDLVKQVGVAVGKEMQEFGVSQWLAPGMNIHRDPLNGRNFEYYSEDPLIAGLTAAATTAGVQSIPGEGVTIKHFAGNNQEANRNAVNDVVDERGMREIELKGFEIAVESAQPKAVMSSYNQISGTYAAQNYDLLTNLLRGEWGFQGLVMSDWGGSHNATATMYAGNDLIEPGGAPNDIITASHKVAAAIDINGLPVYNKSTQTFGTFSFTQYALSLGSFTISATGAKKLTTTVDASTDLTKSPASGSTVAGVFTPNAKFTSVNDAYTQTVAFLAGTALNAGQKAGIAITNIVHADPADATSPVTAYTVTISGSYPTVYPMRLGDLQRSASRVLSSAMQSPQFGQLASLKGVSGIIVKPYSSQFRNLTDYLDVAKGRIDQPHGHH